MIEVQISRVIRNSISLGAYACSPENEGECTNELDRGAGIDSQEHGGGNLSALRKRAAAEILL